MKAKLNFIVFMLMVTSGVENALAANSVEAILNANLGDKTGVTDIGSQQCEVSVKTTDGKGGFELTYYPGWSNGQIGQVVTYPNTNKWTLNDSEGVLSVRIYEDPSGNGIANLKYDKTSGKFILGQVDADADICRF